MQTRPDIQRAFYIASLERALSSGKHALLLGGRKSGKTTVLRQFAESHSRTVVTLDVRRLGLSPEAFAVEFCGSILWALSRKSVRSDYTETASLLKESAAYGKETEELAKTIDNELQKIKPDQRLLVSSAFMFLEAVWSASSDKFTLILDNADDLLQLNNFSQVKDVIKLMGLERTLVPFVFSASAATEATDAFSHVKKLEIMALSGLTAEESSQLVKGWRKSADGKTIEAIHSFSRGHPQVVSLLAQGWDSSLDASSNILKELLCERSQLYQHCELVLADLSSHARGQTLLRSIFTALSHESLRLSEVARKIYRSAPVTKSMLERLIAADAVVKEGKRFSLSDPVLAQWIRMTGEGFDFVSEPDAKQLKEAAKRFT